MLVFAYGTLMYGLAAHGLLAGSVFAGRGWVEGRLYICDGYPLLVAGEDGRVWGELYHVSGEAVPRIDHYEGADIPSSPWRPLRVDVNVDGVRVRARAYGLKSVKEARHLCDELRDVDADDYRVVVGGGPPRWLVAVPEYEAGPPGITLGVGRGSLRGYSWLGDCFSPDGYEEVNIYDVLADRSELEEWARESGCRLGGVRVEYNGVEVYPYALLARDEE